MEDLKGWWWATGEVPRGWAMTGIRFYDPMVSKKPGHMTWTDELFSFGDLVKRKMRVAT